jgi:hypothetical protein
MDYLLINEKKPTTDTYNSMYDSVYEHWEEKGKTVKFKYNWNRLYIYIYVYIGVYIYIGVYLYKCIYT